MRSLFNKPLIQLAIGLTILRNALDVIDLDPTTEDSYLLAMRRCNSNGIFFSSLAAEDLKLMRY
jgi:hypothetical protein